MTIRLLIADDHDLIREGLKYALANAAIKIVGEALNVKEAIERALAGDWDVLLLDLTMPGGDGFDVLEKIQFADPPLSGGPLIYSHRDRPDFRLRAQRLGARGFLHKSATRDEIIDAIQRVARGEHLWDR